MANFLIDINLPPRLCDWLIQRSHQASHLSDLGGLRMKDTQVWQRAAAQRQVIVSKDADFYEWSLIHGQPPQVLLIALGNCSNNDLFHRLDTSWAKLDAQLSGGARLVVLHAHRLEIHV